MASPSSSASPMPSSTSCTTADFTRFPTSDIACAVGSTSALASNTSSVLSTCCKSAPVESFNGDCGYYCLSVQQSVADLQRCFQEGGVSPTTIFCNGPQMAVASGTPRRTAGGASATGSGSPGGDQGGGVRVGVSKAGMSVLGMLFVSAFAGMML